MTAACLLALDTSTDLLAAAVLSPAGDFAVNEAGGPLASARLIPLLLELLDSAGIGLAQLQAIAFGQGPGAFTGLRTPARWPKAWLLPKTPRCWPSTAC